MSAGTKEYSDKKSMSKQNSPMGESFQDYSWIQDFEADFP